MSLLLRFELISENRLQGKRVQTLCNLFLFDCYVMSAISVRGPTVIISVYYIRLDVDQFFTKRPVPLNRMKG